MVFRFYCCYFVYFADLNEDFEFICLEVCVWLLRKCWKFWMCEKTGIKIS